MTGRAEAPTEFGPVTVFWKQFEEIPLVSCVQLPNSGPSVFPGSTRGTCNEIEVILKSIQEMLQGKSVRFHLESIDLSICSEFKNKVLIAEFAIPRGTVSTYRNIALHIGIPGGARAVGNALAGNPFPLIIPCHRAVRSDGSPGGFQGGRKMKKALLELEGIKFNRSGKVKCSSFHYEKREID